MAALVSQSHWKPSLVIEDDQFRLCVPLYIFIVATSVHAPIVVKDSPFSSTADHLVLFVFLLEHDNKYPKVVCIFLVVNGDEHF